MAEFTKFRTSVGGFNRTDVVNYIEQTSREAKQRTDALEAENKKLAEQLAALQQDADRLREENESLQEQVVSLAQEASDYAALLEQATEKADSQEEPPCEEPAAAVPSADALPEKELAAYRRAEAAERNAVLRANRIHKQLSELCEDSRRRYLDSGEEISALGADLLTSLDRLKEAFEEVRVIFDDTENAFDELELPEIEE